MNLEWIVSSYQEHTETIMKDGSALFRANRIETKLTKNAQNDGTKTV